MVIGSATLALTLRRRSSPSAERGNDFPSSRVSCGRRVTAAISPSTPSPLQHAQSRKMRGHALIQIDSAGDVNDRGHEKFSRLNARLGGK